VNNFLYNLIYLMKKILIKFLFNSIFLFPFKKGIEILLKNPHFFKIQQKMRHGIMELLLIKYIEN